MQLDVGGLLLELLLLVEGLLQKREVVEIQD